MTSVASRRCFHHPQREAAAMCRECRRTFCRECVIDSGGELICASCLRVRVKPKVEGRTRFRALAGVLQVGAALVASWFFFYMTGRIFVTVEPPLHRFEDGP